MVLLLFMASSKAFCEDDDDDLELQADQKNQPPLKPPTKPNRLHQYDSYVRGFRREHNVAVVSGLTSGTWKVDRFGPLENKSYPSSGVYAKFLYSFHLPIYEGFGYLLGSTAGYHYESSDTHRAFRPVSAWQYPGVLAGLVMNFNSVVRVSSTIEEYMERHDGIRATDGNKKAEMHVTTNVFDAGFAMDTFYDLTWAFRLEYHQRLLRYEKPTIEGDSTNFGVDAKIGKKDRCWGFGIVYHLI